jgi:hypothetical protein
LDTLLSTPQAAICSTKTRYKFAKFAKHKFADEMLSASAFGTPTFEAVQFLQAGATDKIG